MGTIYIPKKGDVWNKYQASDHRKLLPDIASTLLSIYKSLKRYWKLDKKGMKLFNITRLRIAMKTLKKILLLCLVNDCEFMLTKTNNIINIEKIPVFVPVAK